LKYYPTFEKRSFLGPQGVEFLILGYFYYKNILFVLIFENLCFFTECPLLKVQKISFCDFGFKNTFKMLSSKSCSKIFESEPEPAPGKEIRSPSKK